MAKARRPKSIWVETLTLIAIGLLSFACATTQVSEPAEPAEAAPAEAMAKAKEMKKESMAKAKEMKPEAKEVFPGDGDELVNPPEISATSNLLDIALRIQKVEGQDGTPFAEATAPFRWYGFDPSATGTACPSTYYTDPDNGFCFGPPGPTLRVRRESNGTPAGDYPGDKVTISLTNALEPPNPATVDLCNYEGVDEMPNCYHGDNITNFHFHGFHVSPNPNPDDGQAPGTYSDYILMELWPEGSNKDSCNFPNCKEGTAVFKLNDDNPLIEHQPEGSHWYHPHKHAATALQVTNGMAGAFIVEGPYDDWLADTICSESLESCERPNGDACTQQDTDCRVREKLLILQQIIPELGFPVATAGQPGEPTVNGQVDPKITINPGEIQRWRYFNAGVTSTANYAIEFPKESFYGKCHEGAVTDDWCVKMIAMDGVPFAKENYEAQPLLYKENSGDDEGGGQCLPVKSENENLDGNLCFLLAAGNRADILVQAPIEAQPATHRIGIDFQAEILGFLPQRVLERVRDRRKAEHKLLAKLRPALPVEQVEFTIHYTEIGKSQVQGARLPVADSTYPYNAAGTDESDYASPANLVKTIDSPTIRNEPIVFKMTGYTGGVLPGAWNPDGDKYFGQAINQAINCCRKWNECDPGDPEAKNCCVGSKPSGCFDVSPPPLRQNVPCGEMISQFWIDDQQFEGGTPNYTASLGSKWQYEWQNAVAPPMIETVPASGCPPLNGEAFTVQLRTAKGEGDDPDTIEQFVVTAQLDEPDTNGCSTTSGNYCISGTLDRSGQGAVDQPAAELVAQTDLVQHPIHIHVNPFQVIRDDQTVGVPVFQDTIGLPTTQGGSYNVVQEYLNYDGTFVFHCHILGHEDRGMMQQFCVSSVDEDCTTEHSH